MNHLRVGLAALVLCSAGIMGCENTAEGLAKDAEQAKVTAAAESEKAGEKASQLADNAGQSAKDVGQDLAGALEVTPTIKTAITADPELNDAKNKVDIDSKDGIVHINGHVTSSALKAKATKIATEKIKEMKGTDTVMNHLVVKP